MEYIRVGEEDEEGKKMKGGHKGGKCMKLEGREGRNEGWREHRRRAKQECGKNKVQKTRQ